MQSRSLPCGTTGAAGAAVVHQGVRPVVQLFYDALVFELVNQVVQHAFAQAAAARRPRPFAAAAHSGNGDGTAYDAIIIGSGMGGLTSAAQMVSKGARVLVLEK